MMEAIVYLIVHLWWVFPILVAAAIYARSLPRA